jgi:ribonucleotide reductase beta subunit family protein with ferritin-like domain
MDQQGDLELLVADPSKYVTLPIQNEKLWRKYQTSLDWFWTVYEINLERDKSTVGQLDEEQRSYMNKVLTFMLICHNTITTKELFLDLVNQVEIKEASYYFSSQADSTKTHRMMYSLILDELIGNGEEKTRTMSEVAQIPHVREALRWYVENVNLENQSFAKRMLAFTTLLGIVFNVVFIMFSWIEKTYPSLMHGLMKSNQLIWRDARLNLSFATILFDYIDDKVDKAEAIEMYKTAAQHAKNIFTKALPVSSLGIECDLMEQFIEHSADSLAIDTIQERIFKVEKTPFDWIVEPKVDMNESTANVLITANNDEGLGSFELDGDF